MKKLSTISNEDLILELSQREDLEFDHVGLLADRLEAIIYEDHEDLIESLAAKKLDLDDVETIAAGSNFLVFEDYEAVVEHVQDESLDGIVLDQSNPYLFRKMLGNLLDIPSASVTNERIIQEIKKSLP
jgi:hypothetical protein